MWYNSLVHTSLGFISAVAFSVNQKIEAKLISKIEFNENDRAVKDESLIIFETFISKNEYYSFVGSNYGNVYKVTKF